MTAVRTNRTLDFLSSLTQHRFAMGGSSFLLLASGYHQSSRSVAFFVLPVVARVREHTMFKLLTITMEWRHFSDCQMIRQPMHAKLATPLCFHRFANALRCVHALYT